MTLDDAHHHIGARVQYTSPTGAIVATGTIRKVDAGAVLVDYGFTGEPVVTDPARLRLLPAPRPVVDA